MSSSLSWMSSRVEMAELLSGERLPGQDATNQPDVTNVCYCNAMVIGKRNN